VTTAAVPTVADTKRSFLQNNPKPLPGLYTPIVNELLVQQHLIVFNKTYTHDPVSSLGLLSVWDGVMEGAPNIDSEAVLKALLESLERDPQEYRADAARLEAWAGGKSGVEDLLPAAGGDEVQQELATMAGRHAAGEFLYTKYMAIGLFRLLELGKATDPESLKAMVEALNLNLEKVQSDLLTYKNILSKMAKGKELMEEVLQRERKKTAERLAEKAKAEAEAAGDGTLEAGSA
jgi:photosystem II biogenesis protein Psp29